MIRKSSMALCAVGLLLLVVVANAIDTSAGSIFRPFSGQLTNSVIVAIAAGIVMIVTGLAGLLPDRQDR